MEKNIHQMINHSNSNPLADARSVGDIEFSDASILGDFWRTTLENQVRYASECMNDVVMQMTRNYLMMANQLRQTSTHTERIIQLMAFAICRTLAITMQVRQETCDRRVFSLSLPEERRLKIQMDRRKFISGEEHIY